MLIIRNIVFMVFLVWGLGRVAHGQCDSFHIDFEMYDGDKPIKVCSPARFRVHDISTFNSGDSIVKQSWNREGQDKPSPWCKPSLFIMGTGAFDVWYKAETAGGCFDSIYKENFFTIVSPKPKFAFSDTSYCNVESVLFIDSTEWQGRNGRIVLELDKDTSKWTLKNDVRVHEIQTNFIHWSLYKFIRLYEEVQDPYTGEYKLCEEFYPSLNDFGEWPNLFFRRNKRPDIYERIEDGKVTLSYPHLYTSFYWMGYTTTDSVRIDSKLVVDMRPYKSVKLMAFKEDCMSSKSWSLNSIDEEEAVLSPFSYNSSSQTLWFHLKSQSKDYACTIRAVNGQQIRTYRIEQGKNAWDMRNLSPGIYIVSAFIGNEMKIFRFVR